MLSVFHSLKMSYSYITKVRACSCICKVHISGFHDFCFFRQITHVPLPPICSPKCNQVVLYPCKFHVILQSIYDFTKTYLYKFDPFKPHIFIVKLGFPGVYIIFLISAQKHRLWVLVRTASSRRF